MASTRMVLRMHIRQPLACLLVSTSAALFADCSASLVAMLFAASPPRRCYPVGNVARFINHSCAPNLLVQPVLRPGDSGLKYGVALVAQKRWALGRGLQAGRGVHDWNRRHKNGPHWQTALMPNPARPACALPAVPDLQHQGGPGADVRLQVQGWQRAGQGAPLLLRRQEVRGAAPIKLTRQQLCGPVCVRRVRRPHSNPTVVLPASCSGLASGLCTIVPCCVCPKEVLKRMDPGARRPPITLPPSNKQTGISCFCNALLLVDPILTLRLGSVPTAFRTQCFSI